ncbi:hypothetical protein [Rossellomorea marisflavi]|uniref:hypothetical protein n=1 Tax=Rossellomorea marisflavi TaxID=189381 RepID=UPI00345AB7EA
MKLIVLALLLLLVLSQDLLTFNGSEWFSSLDEILVIVASFYLLIKVLATKSIKKSSLILIIFVALFCFICTLNSIFNGEINIKFIIGTFLYVKCFLLYIGMQEMKINKNQLDVISNLLNYTGYIVVLFAILDFIIPTQFRTLINSYNRLDIRYGLVSVQSLFDHPGTYGWYLMLLSIKNFLQFTGLKKRKNLIISILFLLFSLLSLRFKVILSILPIIFYYLVKSKKSFLMTSVLTIISLLFFSGLFVDLFSITVDRYLNIDYEKSARKALYIFSFIIAKDYFPLGVGVNNYGTMYSKMDYSETYYNYGLNRVWGLSPDNPMWVTDTFWPAVLGETGILGLSMYIIIISYIFRILIRNYKISTNNHVKTYLLIGIFILIQAIIESLGKQVFLDSPQFVIVFGLIAIIVTYANGQQKFKSFKDE